MADERYAEEYDEAHRHHQVADFGRGELLRKRTGQYTVPGKSDTGQEQHQDSGHVRKVNAAAFHDEDEHHAEDRQEDGQLLQE
ncbi:hypothetical protein D3C74_398230 [compost metagenome]